MGLTDKRPPSVWWWLFVLLVDIAAVAVLIDGLGTSWVAWCPFGLLPAIFMTVFTFGSWVAWSQPVEPQPESTIDRSRRRRREMDRVR